MNVKRSDGKPGEFVVASYVRENVRDLGKMMVLTITL